jgi:hypothetical protein
VDRAVGPYTSAPVGAGARPVPAGDVGGDGVEFERLDARLQIRHLDQRLSAHVDPSQERDVPHGRQRSPTSSGRATMSPAAKMCAPALLDVDCKTVDHMRLANALCRFVELVG